MCALFAKKSLNEPETINAYEEYFKKHFKIFFSLFRDWEERVGVKLSLQSFSNQSLSCMHSFLFYDFDKSKFEKHPDEVKDFNYLVDSLEDEHIKTSIFTPRFLVKLEKE